MAMWSGRRPGRRSAWALGGMVGLVVAVTLAGCGSRGQTSTGAARSTATPSSTTRRLAPLVASPPTGNPTPMAYTPAPSDGRVAYACADNPSGSAAGVRVWSTHDRGASWSSGVALPYSSPVSACTLTVDDTDPNRVFVALDTAKGGASAMAAAIIPFLSQDGGATWQALPQVGPHGVFSLTSFKSAIYAAGYGLAATGAPEVDARDVWVSHDGGRSWQALGASHLAPNPRIWINPQTGELVGTNNFDLIPTLWRSEDGGATWTRIAVPTIVSGESGAQGFVVAPNGAGWRICVNGQDGPGPQQKNLLACSDDLGKTWTQPPALNPSQNSPKGFTFTAPSDVFAIADDGSLLATYDDPTAGTELDALAPGAHTWTALGAPTAVLAPAGATGTPQAIASGSLATYSYTTGPGGGMLWANTGDDAHPFITATYP